MDYEGRFGRGSEDDEGREVEGVGEDRPLALRLDSEGEGALRKSFLPLRDGRTA